MSSYCASSSARAATARLLPRRQRRLASSSSSSLPHRPIGNYLGDAWRQATLSPKNPLLELVQKESNADTTRTTTTTTTAVPLDNLGFAQPHHVSAAAAHVVQERIEYPLSSLASLASPSPQSSTTSRTMGALADFVSSANAHAHAAFVLRQVTTLLCLVCGGSGSGSTLSSDTTKESWCKALSDTPDVVPGLGPVSSFRSRLPEWKNDLESASSADNDNNNNNTRDLNWAYTYLLRQCREQQVVSSCSEDEKLLTESKGPAAALAQVVAALQDVESDLLAIPSPSAGAAAAAATPKTVTSVYNYIGLRGQQANMLGYESVAHEAGVTDEIRDLLAALQQRLAQLPPDSSSINDGQPMKGKDEVALDAYLSDNAPKTTTMTTTTGQPSRHRMDELEMVKLEQHVTLDAALEFCSRMAKDLFGISVTQATTTSTSAFWHADVRLYHVHDDDNVLVGSFYVDPLQRPGKEARSFTLPLVPRRNSTAPVVVAMCLEIRPPAWDDDPIMVSWTECEAVFHEFGHVLQFLLAKSRYGALLGPHNMPLAISEFLPKFMEHWLVETSTLYALMDLSNSTKKGVTQDEIEAAYRVRSREKARQLSELLFYSTLELELFSGFDLKGSETVMALQDRLAESIIPHNVRRGDVRPVLDILQENAKGRCVAWYRYLYCDVLSADAFERVKAAYGTESMDQLKQNVRQLVLEPGAAVTRVDIDVAFGLDYSKCACSPDALLQRYGLL